MAQLRDYGSLMHDIDEHSEQSKSDLQWSLPVVQF